MQQIQSSLSKQDKFQLVADMLEINHVTTALESLALASKTGLDLHMLYDIIVGAAGNSTAYELIGADLLGLPPTVDGKIGTLEELSEKLQRILAEATLLSLPLPLTTQSNQLLLASKPYNTPHAQSATHALAKMFEALGSKKIEQGGGLAEVDARTMNGGNDEIKKIAFIGLGSMGLGMALSLHRANLPVVGYDVYPPSLQKFVDAGGVGAKSLEDVTDKAGCLALMVVSIQQAQEILFGTSSTSGIAHLLPPNTPILLHSTVPPSSIQLLQSKLASLPNSPVLLDAPVSGGTIRAADGDLTIMVSGPEDAVSRAKPVLAAVTGAKGIEGRLRVVKGGVGMGSFVKLVNQHLAGVHVALSAEAIALSTRLGLHAPDVFEYISQGEGKRGTSWMFENRVPHMLVGDLKPFSAGAIFVKDMNIVIAEAQNLSVPVFLATSALQLYLYGVGAGWGADDDSGLVRMWEPVGVVAHKKW